MLNRLIQWSIDNRFVVVALALALLVSSLMLFRQMDVDVLPEFAPPQVVVQTEAPGFVAEEVESLVSLPLETAINGTPGVTAVKSLSMAGVSKITVVFRDGTSVYTDRQLIQEKIQLAQPHLPKGAGVPMMEPVMSELGDVLKIGLTSQQMSLMDLRTFADWELKNRILAVPGVARVVVYGGDQRQFQVIIDPDRLRSANVTLDQVVNAVKRCNSTSANGFLITADRQTPIHGMTRAHGLQDIADAVIVTRRGVPIKVQHVAQVKVGPAFKIGDALIDGQRGVELVITKQPWVGTLDVTARVGKALAEMRQANPKVCFTTVFRQADFIELSISNMVWAIWVGAAIVVTVLLLFLFNWRTSIISLLAIPASLLCATLLIKGSGGSVNTMTLGGLAIAVGEVVDDAVVDVENVFRRLRENRNCPSPDNPFKVIFKACKEVRSSVVYATFIVALVFLPVFTLGGVEGRLFGQLGISYVSATMSSLLIALTLTPALCAYLLARQQAVPVREPLIIRLVKRLYASALRFVLARPAAIVGAALIAFLLSVSLLPFMGHAFLPDFQERDLMIPTSAMAGQNLESTTRVGRVVAAAMGGGKDILHTGQRIGRAELDEDAAATSFDEFEVKLSRDADVDATTDRLRKMLAQVPGITFEIASFLNDHINDVLSGGTQADVVIKIFGPDVSKLRSLSEQVAAILRHVPGMVDVTPEQQVLIPEVSIRLDRLKAARYGITADAVANGLSTVLGGPVVSQVLESEKLFGLRVWGADYTRENLDQIRSLPIDTADGARVPLSDVATVSYTQGANAIVRENVNRRITVLANIKGKNMVGIVNDARARIEKSVSLPVGYYIDYAGQYAAQKESSKRLAVMSVLALLGIMVLLTQGLGGWRPALLVISNLPLAAIGGLLAVAFTGHVLTIGSLIGFISLFGISTRNSLLLVSHIKHLAAAGMDRQLAIYQGCLDRVAPVLMTALTAALGMLPLAVLGGSGRELEQPLAIVIVGGLASSTILTLLVIPALYAWLGEKLESNSDPWTTEESAGDAHCVAEV